VLWCGVVWCGAARTMKSKPWTAVCTWLGHSGPSIGSLSVNCCDWNDCPYRTDVT
jgi:hypothetical protein